MATDFLARPDSVSFELAALPSRYAAFWRKRGLPLIGWTVESAADEKRASALVDDFFLTGYLLDLYRTGA